MQDLEWSDLRYVLAAARAGTLQAAAQRLDVDATTVARRLRRLERALQAGLFVRTEGRLQPTDAGAAVIAHAEHVEREVGALEARVRGTDHAAAGSVRLTTVPILVSRVLVPAFPSLAARHPHLRLELVAEPQNLSLLRRDADIAVRMARPDKEQSVTTRRIGWIEYAPYAAVGIDPGTLPWITYEERMAGLPQARWIASALRPGESSLAMAVNDAEALLEAVRSGLGKTLLPRLIADRDPDLVTLGTAPPPLSRELWLLVHPDLRHLARVQAVIRWLVWAFNAETRQSAPTLSGPESDSGTAWCGRTSGC
jgi:DNA-binding transcriptional LysR family regulator